tara:strand:- start:1046 stop:1261 length:216 start_codon:yes stop_codon:yes gene_type:complete
VKNWCEKLVKKVVLEEKLEKSNNRPTPCYIGEDRDSDRWRYSIPPKGILPVYRIKLVVKNGQKKGSTKTAS